MSIFQIISATFAVCMLYLVNIHRRKLVMSTVETIAWQVIWVGFIFLSLFPQSLDAIVGVLHFARVFDLLTVMAFMFLTILVVTSYFKQREIIHRLEHLVRIMAIKKLKERKSK